VTCRAGALSDIVAHATEAKPAECCGLLLGRAGEIIEAIRIRNLEADPTRYSLDPGEHIKAQRDARARGLDVLGFYHSHPHSAPEPSPSDIAEATGIGSLYLIVSLKAPPAARLFRWDGSRFEPVALTVDA
jgi:proteasome lid subunit RPN8/RPN11